MRSFNTATSDQAFAIFASLQENYLKALIAQSTPKYLEEKGAVSMCDFVLLQQLPQQGRRLSELSGIADVSDQPYQGHTHLICGSICDTDMIL